MRLNFSYMGKPQFGNWRTLTFVNGDFWFYVFQCNWLMPKDSCGFKQHKNNKKSYEWCIYFEFRFWTSLTNRGAVVGDSLSVGACLWLQNVPGSVRNMFESWKHFESCWKVDFSFQISLEFLDFGLAVWGMFFFFVNEVWNTCICMYECN